MFIKIKYSTLNKKTKILDISICNKNEIKKWDLNDDIIQKHTNLHNKNNERYCFNNTKFFNRNRIDNDIFTLESYRFYKYRILRNEKLKILMNNYK